MILAHIARCRDPPAVPMGLHASMTPAKKDASSKHRRRRAAAITILMFVLTLALTLASTRSPVDASPPLFETTAPRTPHPSRAPSTPGVPLQIDDASVSRPSMWLRGRVVSARTGLGIPAASIVILRQGRVESLQSNPDGDFEFVPWMPGDYVIAGASHPDFQPFAPAHGNDGLHLRFEPGTSFANITLVLAPLIFCDGIVKDEQERPVPHAKVRFLSTGRWDPVSAPSQRTFEADETGHFRIPLIPDALIQAESGHAHSRVECLCLITECPLRLEVSDETPAANLLYIEGKVLDTRGDPVPDIRVSATSAGLRRARKEGEAPINDGGIDEDLLSMLLEIETRDEAITDEGGYFAIGPLQHEPYDVFISTVPETAVSAMAGTQELRLTLPEPGQARGHVFAEEDDSPVTSVSFVVEKYRSNGELAGGLLGDRFRQSSVRHDASGSFEFRQLVPGEYRFHVAALGFSSATQTVAVRAGETAQLTFALKRARAVRGIVTDAKTGRPLSGAIVTAWRSTLQGDWSEAVAMGSIHTRPLLARTTADGAFELAAGDEPLWISHEGYNSWVLRERAQEGRVLYVMLSLLENGQPPFEEFGGVGMAYDHAPGLNPTWQIQQVVPGSPAERSGINEKDMLLAIDNVSAIGMDMLEVISRVRGEPGTQVRLRLSTGSAGREYEVVLTRTRFSE
ncbi:carboxypeptidase regulatory-like domain-containing protein [Myxococcus sp. CA039A]|uniref:carboxypeptidase regulatory-like domain-containing protein n=1 Tax=Myxococcus sp. CA039A TaxID=2741737 RepID=UPI00157A7E2E|nr:carboxypeptidase regulatory-like domain-containing protein [Myxococcus sp. CA039A]NTX52570.1 carboxypeptidase regulatory-like domain-containing protein [Myxococcus sp. CA039A]